MPPLRRAIPARPRTACARERTRSEEGTSVRGIHARKRRQDLVAGLDARVYRVAAVGEDDDADPFCRDEGDVVAEAVGRAGLVAEPTAARDQVTCPAAGDRARA